METIILLTSLLVFFFLSFAAINVLVKVAHEAFTLWQIELVIRKTNESTIKQSLDLSRK